MNEQELKAHWETLNNLITELLNLSKDTFSKSEIKEVEDYLNKNEFGIAVMTYMGICIEENKPPPCNEIKNILKELSSLMPGILGQQKL